MARVKRDDRVMVIAGKDRGKAGRVLKVKADGKKVLVEKLNMVKRHTKPTNQSPQGGIVDKEAPIDISNVMLLDKAGRPVRVGFRFEEVDGKRKKVRYAKQTGEALDG